MLGGQDWALTKRVKCSALHSLLLAHGRSI